MCLSGYGFRRALISHAEILNRDQRHFFRKYCRQNNKKVTLIYEKTVKNRPLPGYLLPVGLRPFLGMGSYATSAFCVRAIYLTQKPLRASGGLSPGHPE